MFRVKEPIRQKETNNIEGCLVRISLNMWCWIALLSKNETLGHAKCEGRAFQEERMASVNLKAEKSLANAQNKVREAQASSANGDDPWQHQQDEKHWWERGNCACFAGGELFEFYFEDKKKPLIILWIEKEIICMVRVLLQSAKKIVVAKLQVGSLVWKLSLLLPKTKDAMCWWQWGEEVVGLTRMGWGEWKSRAAETWLETGWDKSW